MLGHETEAELQICTYVHIKLAHVNTLKELSEPLCTSKPQGQHLRERQACSKLCVKAKLIHSEYYKEKADEVFPICRTRRQMSLLTQFEHISLFVPVTKIGNSRLPSELQTMCRCTVLCDCCSQFDNL